MKSLYKIYQRHFIGNHIANNKLPITQKGSSLIEVIIVMFIIGALFILYASAMNTIVLTKKLRNQDFAYHVANKQIENLRAIDVASLPASGTIADPLLANLPSGAGSYTVVDHVGFNGLKEITVTVTWNDGANKQIQIKTLAGTGGINP